MRQGLFRKTACIIKEKIMTFLLKVGFILGTCLFMSTKYKIYVNK